MAKRQAGDVWGLIVIDSAGIKRAVQIGYWEMTTWPYAKQAQAEADAANEISVRYNHNERYEIRYIGNSKTGFQADNDDVLSKGHAMWYGMWV